MIAGADVASIERLLEPLGIEAIPDFGDTHPDEIFEGFNQDLDAIIQAESERSGWDWRHIRQFGNISVTAIVTPHEASGNLSENYRERRLRVAVPWVAGEPDEAPAEIMQFKTTHQSAMYGSTSPRGRRMQLSSGVVILHKPLLEAVGVDIAQSPIDTEELLK